MRRQVLAGIVAVGLFTVAPVYATVVDFSNDPNLATQWTQYDYLNYFNNPDWSTAAWNSTNQNLDLTANMGTSKAIGYRGLYKTGETRSDTDGVTVTFSNYQGTYNATGWNNSVGLVVSSVAQPNIFGADPCYELFFEYDSTVGGFHYKVLKNGLTTVLSGPVTTVPSTIVLDILREGSNYVFMANGVELCSDSSVTASLPYYFLTWSANNTETLSVSADNFGTFPAPEPGTLALLGMALLGLLCYAWRKRK